MAMIDEIREKLKRRQYEFSKHAVDQSIVRDISVNEVEEAMASRMKETMVDTRVTYTLEHSGRFFIVENVPARVCQETGEQFFSPETVEHIQSIIKSRKRPDRLIETPVYNYA